MKKRRNSLKEKIYEIIFGTETPAGKLFDIILLWAIILSIIIVMLDSVPSIEKEYRRVLIYLEWFFTILFTIEYLLRIYSEKKPIRYIFSFFGIIDLLAILPTYLSLIFTETRYLLVIRSLRLLRIFRILKLGRYLGEAQTLIVALRASRPKIIVFLGTVLSIVIIMGAIMYMVEGEKNGFSSIPRSIYWAIVTLTTVGYGDIAPQTMLGQFLAAIIMIMGYAIIAVPTGIVSVNLAEAEQSRREAKEALQQRQCPSCNYIIKDSAAKFCQECGMNLVTGSAGLEKRRIRRKHESKKQ